MNPSTASGRLIKDLLWNFIVEAGKNKCYKCGQEMNRETFSVEHKIPWLDSDDPKRLFFDLNNIAYSHLICNIKAARCPHKYEDRNEAYNARKRSARNWKHKHRVYDPQERKERYERLGT